MQASETETEQNAVRPVGQCFKCIVAPLLCALNHIFSCLTLICIPFKDFFASVQRASKRDNNNRTPGEGTCFELGK